MSRLVVVSNRVDAAGTRPAAGGLAVALRGVLGEHGGLWFGWSGRVAPAGRQGATRLRRVDGVQVATVDLPRREYDGFYRGFCNAVLWPACHDLQAAGAPDLASAYRSYLAANRRYAAALLPLLRGDDRIWVHDFQLVPLGRLLRRGGATQPLGFFLHVPFPNPARLAALPQAARLVRALLAYDLLGFQTRADLEAFRAAVGTYCGRRALADDGSIRRGRRRLQVGVMPVGVDVEAIRREAGAVPAQRSGRAGGSARDGSRVPRAWQDPLRGLPRDPCRIVGVDRLDPAKGLCERLAAYERLLRRPGIDPRQLSLLQLVTPPRGAAADAAALRRTFGLRVRLIQSQHRAVGAAPLRVLHGALPHGALMALLAGARVGVVTSLKDGMNLVAKEYVAAQDPADPGVLVLSVHAGAAQQLSAAIQVDPRDAEALATALHDALRMPLDERRRRHASMLAALRSQDLRGWAAQFLERLAGAADGRCTKLRPPARSVTASAPVSPAPLSPAPLNPAQARPAWASPA